MSNLITLKEIKAAATLPVQKIWVEVEDQWTLANHRGHYIHKDRTTACHSWFQQNQVDALYGPKDVKTYLKVWKPHHLRLLNRMLKEVHPSLRFDPKTCRIRINTGNGIANFIAMTLVRYTMEFPLLALIIMRAFQKKYSLEVSILLGELIAPWYIGANRIFRDPLFACIPIAVGDDIFRSVARWREVPLDKIVPYGLIRNLRLSPIDRYIKLDMHKEYLVIRSLYYTVMHCTCTGALFWPTPMHRVLPAKGRKIFNAAIKDAGLREILDFLNLNTNATEMAKLIKKTGAEY